MRHITPLVYASFSTLCLSISLNTVWSIDDMLIGFFSSSPSLLGFGSLQDFQNSYVIPLCPWHLPACVCFSASFISSIVVFVSCSFVSSPLSLSFMCFFFHSLYCPCPCQVYWGPSLERFVIFGGNAHLLSGFCLDYPF